jgi:hypothetical protein
MLNFEKFPILIRLATPVLNDNEKDSLRIHYFPLSPIRSGKTLKGKLTMTEKMNSDF